MNSQIKIPETFQQLTAWQNLKAQLNSLVAALDYDPLSDAHEKARALNREIECLKARVQALEGQVP